MKKISTILSVVMLFLVLGANAQSRKSWDFTKGVSDSSREMLDADAATWSKTVNADGVSTAWTTNINFDGELTANGVVIPEFAGLKFGDFQAANAVMYRITNVRLQKNCSITLPTLSAGQKVTIVAQSANGDADDRGFSLKNAQTEEGETSVILLGNKVEGSPGVYTVVATVVADGVVKLSTGLSGDPKSGIEILSIIIDEGDKNIKTWDFTKWSDATKAQILAAEDWTKAENASKEYIEGDEIRWVLNPTVDANEDLIAGGAAIAEMKGLRHNNLGEYGMATAFNYQTTTDGNNWGPYASPAYLWITGTASSIVVPNVKAGSTFKLGVESHKPGDKRGLKVVVKGTEVGTTQTTADFAVLEYTIPAEGSDEYVDVTLTATKGLHLYSIEAEVKDESVVDKNPKLGEPVYSLKNGSKINPSTVEFTMTFPKAANVAEDAIVTIEGYCGPAGLDEGEKDNYVFDGVEFMLGEGLTFTFSDYIDGGLLENTNYEFYLTKLVVDGYEALNKEAAEGEQLYLLSFETTGPGIEEPRAWEFHNTAEDAEALAAAVELGYWNASSKGRYSVSTKMFANGNRTLLIAEGTLLRITDGLEFTMSNDNDILVGTPEGNNDRLQLGGGAPNLIIPSCNAGDEVTIKGLWSTKNNSTITINNGTAEDGTNTITLTGSSAEYKITVSENGDLVLASKNVVYQAVSVFPSTIQKETVQYTINAVDEEGNVLKKLDEGKGKTNDKIEVAYSHYVADAAGNVYTAGSIGTPFTSTFTLSAEGIYNVTYKKCTYITDAVLCVEGEDIEGTTLLTTGNMGVRASNQKAAYNENDIVLATLQPGTYKIKAGLFDVKPISYVATFTLGNASDIELASTADNLSEVESDLITVTEATELIWKAGGDDKRGLDYIVVYPSEDAPDDPTGISGVYGTTATQAQPVKVMKNGRVVVESANGTYTVAGAKMQ